LTPVPCVGHTDCSVFSVCRQAALTHPFVNHLRPTPRIFFLFFFSALPERPWASHSRDREVIPLSPVGRVLKIWTPHHEQSAHTVLTPVSFSRACSRVQTKHFPQLIFHPHMSKSLPMPYCQPCVRPFFVAFPIPVLTMAFVYPQQDRGPGLLDVPR